MQVPVGIQPLSASDTRSTSVRLLRVFDMQVPIAIQVSVGIQLESASDARSNRVRLLCVCRRQEASP
eukprot:851257-Pyramimonas_sp.AAC.1